MNIDTHTHLYAVFGDPVTHSLSPVIHNRAFIHCGVNSVYLAFQVTDIAAAVQGMRAMGIRGASVTIPHKVAVMAHLDEVEGPAQRIGAVNTIVNRHGRLIGSNTDTIGAVTALMSVTRLSGRRAALIGAGGAARAVGFGLVDHGAELTVYNRTAAKGEHLAADLNADFYPLTEFGRRGCDILVNTTAVGMTPHVDAMPVPPDALTAGMVVMDIVYNPVETKLLSAAANKGCTTVDGMAMFIHQGAAQFEVWTGLTAPLAEMRAAVTRALEKNGKTDTES